MITDEKQSRPGHDDYRGVAAGGRPRPRGRDTSCICTIRTEPVPRQVGGGRATEGAGTCRVPRCSELGQRALVAFLIIGCASPWGAPQATPDHNGFLSIVLDTQDPRRRRGRVHERRRHSGTAAAACAGSHCTRLARVVRQRDLYADWPTALP